MKFYRTNSKPLQIITTFIATALVAISLFGVQNARAAIPAFVQVQATKTSSGATNNSTFNLANGAGDLIVVHVLWGNSNAVTLSDTKGNTYTAVAPATRFNNNQYSSQVFYAKNIAAATANSNTVTATFSSAINNWAMVYAHEYSGMDKVTPVDVLGTTTGTGTNLTGSLTTHQNNSLIFAAAVASDSKINTADSSYAVHSKLSQDWTMSKLQATAGTVTAGATRAGNGSWLLQMVAFRPDGTPPPNQPPVVSMIKPVNGAAVRGSTWLRANAIDPDGVVARVEFYAGTQLLHTDTTAPYEFQLDTTTLANASHTLTAKAYDSSTSTTSSPVQITVDNAAPTAPTNLQASNVTSSQATLSWNPSTDNRSVSGYRVFKDGVLLATITHTSYQAVGLTPAAGYTFTVSAYDGLSNESPQSAPLTLTTLPDAPPQISVTAPANGVTVRASVAVTAIATDDVSVNRVEFRVDGVLVDVDNVAQGGTYETALDTTTLTNETHEIKAAAFDNMGQSSEASVTIAVDNLAPGTPADFAAQAESSSQINLTWSGSTGDVAYYKLFRGSTEIAGNLAATNYTDTGLAPSTTYDYSLKAYDVAGNESPVAAASATTLAASDTTAAILSNGQPAGQQPAGTSSVVLALDTNEAATCKYTAIAGTVYGAMPNTFSSTGATRHTGTISGLLDGQTYNFYIRCQDLSGNTNMADYTISFWINSAQSGTTAWPLKSSSNGRYLTDQNNVPYLMIGDSPQGLIVGLNLTDSEEYFQRSQDHGINTVWVNLLAKGDNGGRPDGSTFDGITPFMTVDNLSTPRAAYFDRAASMIAQAQSHNITVILDPIETINHLDVLRNNAANVYQYGRFLGNRFKAFPNIIWMYGNDYTPNASDNALLFEVQRGIKETDSPNRLHTVELYPTPNGSYSDPAWIPHIDIDLAYTYGVGYDQILKEYNRSADPVIMIESHYDFEDAPWIGHQPQPPLSYRKQELWTFLSGGKGYIYGNYYTVNMAAGWQTRMDTPAVAQLKYIKDSLLAPVAWYNLVPDQNHTFLTGGFGNDNGVFLTDTHAAAARTPDGSLGMVYIPNAREGITIDMTKMNGPTTARWFDPTSNTFTTIGTYANTGSRVFTPPKTTDPDGTVHWIQHADLTTDWVLVLETAPAMPDTQPPSIPTNLTATAVSSGQINLSWTASTDNVAVTGYSVYRNGVLVNGNVTGTSYQDTGLTADTPYTYNISAHDAADNNSAQSANASATTPPPDTTPPSVPTALSAAAVSSSQININWNTSSDNPGGSGLKQYRVYRSTDDVQFTELTPFPTSATFNSTGLNPSTLYYYKVKAEDMAGNLSDFSSAVTASTSAGTPLSAFLKAAWGFNENTGTTTADTSTNGNTATIVGASWVAGKYGSGLSFGGGSSSHLAVANSSSLNISGSELTLSMWLNPLPPSTSDAVVLGKYWNTSWTDPYFQYGLELGSGNRPTFILGTATGYRAVSMSTTLPYGQWHHLAVTFNGSEVRFYVDGNLTSTQPLIGVITSRVNPIGIGADQANGQGYKGIIDDVRIYNKALTSAEIQTDLNTSL